MNFMNIAASMKAIEPNNELMNMLNIKLETKQFITEQVEEEILRALKAVPLKHQKLILKVNHNLAQ